MSCKKENIASAELNRGKKLKLNTIFSLLNQLVALVCGFILPRFILRYYGSATNGLVSSVSHFLSLISLCELGVGAVVQSALYKPLAEKNEEEIGKIMTSARRFFDKIGIIMVIYTVGMIAVYPWSVREEFDYLPTAFLIVSMSITYFSQYFFGIKYQLFLNADQKSYIQLLYQILTVLLGTGVSILLIVLGYGIGTVKICTAFIYLLRPLGLVLYVRKNYKINMRMPLTNEPLQQKWNGLAQHLSLVVLNNTDVVVLTFFSSISSVSVYNVYYLVTNGIKSIIVSMTTGLQALFGNMLAKNEKEKLTETFNTVEWLLHTAVTLLCTVTGVLIVPFVQVYTANITDADYIVPVFAALLTAATASYCLRLPYNMIILAAGHYKQTQGSAFIEMALNVFLSILLVFFLGITGVAIGTLVAMAYRTVYFAFYLRKNILQRKLKYFCQHLLVDVATAVAIVVATVWLRLTSLSYLSWLCLSLEVFGIALCITAVINVIFYRKEIKSVASLFRRKTVL